MCNKQLPMKDIPENLEYFSNIDISNIKAGDRYFNYQELCDVIGLDMIQRKNKDKVLKEFSRLVKYIKVGRAFVVKEVYRVPMHIKAQGQYQEYFQILIRNLLAQTDDLKIETTYSQLFTLLGIVNSNLSECLFHKGEYSYLIDTIFKDIKVELPVEIFSDFKAVVPAQLKRKIKSSLEYMARQQSVLYTFVKWVRVSDKSNPLQEYSRYNAKRFSQSEIQNDKYRPMSEVECSEYADAENHILQKLSLSSKEQMYATRKGRIFNAELRKYIKKKYGWDYVYGKIRIWYNTEGAGVSKTVVKRMLLNEAAKYNVKAVTKELNKKVVMSLLDSVSRRCEIANQVFGGAGAEYLEYNGYGEDGNYNVDIEDESINELGWCSSQCNSASDVTYEVCEAHKDIEITKSVQWGNLKWEKQVQLAYTDNNAMLIWNLLINEYFNITLPNSDVRVERALNNQLRAFISSRLDFDFI